MLDAAWLATRVGALCPGARGWWVAFSGGLDSRALLHALASARDELEAPLGAVHVEHGLHPDAADWAADCRAFCASLDVPFEHLRVDARPGPGESPEAAARAARYRALREWLPEGHALLTAHHRDDQAETLLLQLLRGAGPHGLAAMPEQAAFGHGHLIRPLLGLGRSDLCQYAETAGLEWIEDPANRELRYDRNLLRHEILPRLARRWPAAAAVLARDAELQAEAAALLDDLAALDLAPAQGRVAGTLSVPALCCLTPRRRRNLLRHWLREQGLRPPSRAVLRHIECDMLEAEADAMPRVHWPEGEVRRFQDALYAMPPLPPAPDSATIVPWDGGPLALPQAGGRLEVRRVTGQGLAQRLLETGLEIRFRRGGERLRPAGSPHRRTLKHLLQEAGIPPWERERLPLVYSRDELVAVAGLWVAEGATARGEEPGLLLHWSRLP